MKKVAKKMIAAMTLASMSISLFACMPGNDRTSNDTTTDGVNITDKSSETERDTEPVTEPQPAPKEMITIIESGKTDYKIRVSDEIKEENKADFDYLFAVMDKKYGTHPDFGDGDTHIISFKKSGEPLDYSVIIDKEKCNIYVTAGGTVSMKEVILRFVSQYCGNSDNDFKMDVEENIKYVYSEDKIDNSSYLTYKGGDKTTLSPSNSKGDLMTPDWLDSLVMVELRIDTASIGGKFQDSYDLIDFYAQTGVNGIWLAPIYERGPGGNGYGNIGLHSVEPALTGTSDYEEGWKVVKEFIDYAHSKGIYIFLDVISWGTMKEAPLVKEHPDWFDGEAWGNAAFNWKNDEMKEWFISTAVENIEKTGADGYRCDCEPFTAGYNVYAEIRKRLSDKGIYIVIMSEEGGERKTAFDMEQDGVLLYSAMSRGELYQKPVNFFVDGYLNIVESTKDGIGLGSINIQRNKNKRGTFRYYTNCITNHDYQRRDVNGNRLKIGYAAIFAPYIPIWYMGDEFGVEYLNAVLYDTRIDYSLIETNEEKAVFYEDVKRMLEIRRKYEDIFNYFPINHRNSNICEVKAEGLSELQNYARFKDNRAIVVVANNEEDNLGVCTVNVSLDMCELSQYSSFVVTDLQTGQIREYSIDSKDKSITFSAVIPYLRCGSYLIEGIEK